MKTNKFVIVFAMSIFLCGYAWASITVVGDVVPSDPAQWSYETLCIGLLTSGSVTMNGGSSVTNGDFTYVGYSAAVDGTLSMSGGSTFTSHGFFAGYYGSSKGTLVLDGAGTKLTVAPDADTGIVVGYSGASEATITNGAQIEAKYLTLCSAFTAAAAIKVDGAGSKILSTDYMNIGRAGTRAYLEVNHGGSVEGSTFGNIATNSNSDATVLVDGAGSKLSFVGYLNVGCNGNGKLIITNEGLVKVGGLTMNLYGSSDNGYIKMLNHGKLALYGNGTASITAFLGLIDPDGAANNGVGTTDTIYYWDGSAWSKIINATAGVDYTLAAGTGDLTGYTVLTVTALGCISDIDGDFDGSCTVNLKDMAKMAANWLVDCTYGNDVGNPACQ